MPLALWKRSHSPPAGAMPGGLFTKIGLLILGSLLVGVLVFDFFSADETAAPGGGSSLANQQPADQQAYQAAKDRVAGETRRMQEENAARARDELRRQQQQRQTEQRSPQAHMAADAAPILIRI